MSGINNEFKRKTITLFHPFKEPGNYYSKEIANHFDGVFHYGSLFDTVEAIDLIHIHWPEAIFDWKEPSNENLLALEQRIVEWKQATKIIYTRHNEVPHEGSIQSI